MLVRADALFEGVLGVVLLLTAASGALDGSDFPWIGTAVLLIVGWLLLILCGVIWSGRIGLRELVLCNALSALAGFLWLLLAGGWSTPGAVLVAITVAVLAGLAVTQAATLRA